MDTYLLRIFQQQALDQCEFLLIAADDVGRGLKSGKATDVLYAVQNILNAAANLSKLFWGQRGKFADQRKRLRESVGLSDLSPIRQVTMRNHFEHMDERIDRWWSDSTQHNHIDRWVGDPERIKGFAPIDTFRFFDPNTGDVIFWGESFNLMELVREAQRINPLLREEASKPHWDPIDLQ